MTQIQISCIALGLIPFLWSAIVWSLRATLRTTHGDDTSEKLYLGAMLAAGILALIVPLLPSRFAVTHLPLPGLSEIGSGAAQLGDTAAVAANTDWASMLGWNFCLLYIFGLAIATARLCRQLFFLVSLEAAAKQDESGAFWLVQANVAAIASFTGKVILSEQLFSRLNTEQTRFILAHERAHIARKDPYLFIALSLLDTVFWFNPFIRLQTDRCRQAAELACDACVVRKEPQMRSAYASSLLDALKHTAGNARPCVPAAFSLRRKGDYRMRMENIMQPKAGISKSGRAMLVAGLTSLMLPLAASQLAFASPAKTFTMSSLPVDGKVTSAFGSRVHPVTKEVKIHSGLDIAAAKGTPVSAPAAGTVVSANFSEGYGNMVTLDHGNGTVTRYAQLDTFSVKTGDHVSKGMKIGEVGATGKYATGPHLHFEVLQDGEHKDPASFLHD